MTTLTLIYENGERFVVGGFPSEDEAIAWVENEKLQPYWQETTQVEIVTNTKPPI